MIPVTAMSFLSQFKYPERCSLSFRGEVILFGKAHNLMRENSCWSLAVVNDIEGDKDNSGARVLSLSIDFHLLQETHCATNPY